MTVVWYVKVRAKEGEEARVRDGLARLAPAARAVPGCLRFDVLAESEDPRAFSIYEQWADHASHDVHVRSDHFRDLAQAEVTDRSEPLESIELELLA